MLVMICVPAGFLILLVLVFTYSEVSLRAYVSVRLADDAGSR